jgi:ribosome-binding protein aMBF1 (putative translation factor)
MASTVNEEDKRKIRAKSARLMSQWDHSMRVAISGTRRDKGWSQEDVADRTGWTVDIISNIETGRKAVTIPEFCWLARAMDVDPEVMFRRVLKW